MDNQNSELKTNEECSEESDFYSEEEEKQLISKVLMLCAEVLQDVRQDVSKLIADSASLYQKH